VLGAANYVTVEHAADTPEALFTAARGAGFVNAVAVERNGRRRTVLIAFQNIALIAEGDEREPRVQVVRPSASKLS
jgi:hypothetical protein